MGTEMVVERPAASAAAGALAFPKNLEKIWVCGWAAWLRGLNSVVIEGRSNSKEGKTGCYCTPLLQGACLASFIAYCRKAQQPQQQHQLGGGKQRGRRVLLQRLQQLREEQLKALTPSSAARADSTAAIAPQVAQRRVQGADEALAETAAAPSAAFDVPAAALAMPGTAPEDYCIPADGQAAYCFLASFEAQQESRLMHPFFCDSVPHAAAAAAAVAAVKRAQRAQQQQQEQRAAAGAFGRELPQHELAAAASAPEAAAAAALSSLRNRAGLQHHRQQQQLQQHDRQRQERSHPHTQPNFVKREPLRGSSSSASSTSGVALLNPRLPLLRSRRLPSPYGFASVLSKSLRAVETQQAPSALLAVAFAPRRPKVRARKLLPQLQQEGSPQLQWICSSTKVAVETGDASFVLPSLMQRLPHTTEVAATVASLAATVAAIAQLPVEAAAVAGAAIGTDCFGVLQVCFAAGENACLSSPPKGLIRLFEAAGVPIPPYAAAAAAASASAAAPADGDLMADTRASRHKVRASAAASEQQQLLAACPYDCVFSFAASEAAKPGDAAAALATATAAPATGARNKSSKTRLLPHRRQPLAGHDATLAGGGAGAAPSALTHQPLPPLSRSEWLQLLQLPAPLEVWGEFFCSREKRWIACVIRGPTDSIFDAADVLAGRKGSTMSSAAAAAAAECKLTAAAAAAQEVLLLQFLRCCCAAEQQKLEDLQQRQQHLQRQQLLLKQQREEAAAAAQRAQALTSGLLLNFKPRRRRLGALGSSSSSSGSEGSSDASEERNRCSVAEAPGASVSSNVKSARQMGEAAHAAAAATVSAVPRIPRKDLHWPRYWEAKPWGLLFLSPNHLSLFVLPQHHRQQQQHDALRHPLLRMLLWRLQAKLVNPPAALQQLMIALTDALDSESCARDDHPSSSNSYISSSSSERQPAPHEMAEEAALIADAFAAAWKQSSSSRSSRKRGRAAMQGSVDAITPPKSHSTSDNSSRRGTLAASLRGQGLLGADFLQARRQRTGGLQQQGQTTQQRQQVQHRQQQLQRERPSASGHDSSSSAAGAGSAVKVNLQGTVEDTASGSNAHRPCPEPQLRQQQQGKLFALEQQGRAAVRFVLAVEASGALKDVTYRYASRQASLAATGFRGRRLIIMQWNVTDLPMSFTLLCQKGGLYVF
ncbi:hypothetical protein Emag_003540 [Eimeria magna]